MRIPTLRGIIDRRILVNYRVDPDVAARILPHPFRPKVVRGCALAGICLIRLRDIRLSGLPAVLGISSENAAHRFAVAWGPSDGGEEGVYIPRRDTSAWINQAAGGRLFPGVQHRARFRITEGMGRFHVAMDSLDGRVSADVDARISAALPADSVFSSLDAAVRFFEAGCVACSDTGRSGELDAMELRCRSFRMEPLAVDRVSSSFFDDPRIFPAGSVEFDSALLMRDIEHTWHERPSVRASSASCTLPLAHAPPLAPP